MTPTEEKTAILDIMEVMHEKVKIRELERQSEDEFSPENTLDPEAEYYANAGGYFSDADNGL